MPLAIDIALRAKRFLVELALGALIDDGALLAGEWPAVGIGLEEILAHLGPYFFKEKAQVPDDRIVAQNGMAGLGGIAHTQRENEAADDERDRGNARPMRGIVRTCETV